MANHVVDITACASSRRVHYATARSDLLAIVRHERLSDLSAELAREMNTASCEIPEMSNSLERRMMH